MPAISPQDRCVHCLRRRDDITRDHVFPRSWYAENTHSTVQRWTVPCCRPCNKYLGAMESNLLIRMALCLDPKSEAAKGVREKALRSLGINAAQLGASEQEHRENLRLKLKAELIRVPAGQQMQGAIPGLAQNPGLAGYAVPIPYAGLAIVAEKIVRGCEYKINSMKLVEPPYSVRVRASDPHIIEAQFLSHRRVIDFGPGCQVLRIFAAEDENVVQYRVLIWGALCLYVHFNHEDYFRSESDPKGKSAEGIYP